MAGSLRSREARLHINLPVAYGEALYPQTTHGASSNLKKMHCLPSGSRCSPRTPLLFEERLLLKGREKPNRMFIFAKLKSQPPRLRININFMGLWAVRSSRFLQLFQPRWDFTVLISEKKANKGIRGLSVCSCVRPKLIQVLHPCPQPQGCVSERHSRDGQETVA